MNCARANIAKLSRRHKNVRIKYGAFTRPFCTKLKMISLDVLSVGNGIPRGVVMLK
jgi:hypothetical protein